MIDEKHEGVKFKDHGGWAEQPGHPIWVREYESMEEFSKVWSDEEYQTEFIKIGRLVKNLRMRILRPIIHTPP